MLTDRNVRNIKPRDDTEQGDILWGRKQIAAYMRISQRLLTRLIDEEGLLVWECGRKLVTHKGLIKDWLLAKIDEQTQEHLKKLNEARIERKRIKYLERLQKSRAEGNSLSIETKINGMRQEIKSSRILI